MNRGVDGFCCAAGLLDFGESCFGVGETEAGAVSASDTCGGSGIGIENTPDSSGGWGVGATIGVTTGFAAGWHTDKELNTVRPNFDFVTRSQFIF